MQTTLRLSSTGTRAPGRFAIASFVAWLTLSSSPAHAEIEFTGLDDAQETNARALLPLTSATCDTNQWRVERLFRDADDDLRKALQALGYYDIEIGKNLSWTEECWRAEFTIAPGEPVRYRVVDIQLDDVALANAGLQQLALANQPLAGAILNHGNYERFKSTILQHLSNQGFFEARFKRKEVIVEPEMLSADVFLHLESGPRYQFGDIRFTEGILRDDLLHAYTDIEKGDYYSAAQISELYESLNGSGYFSSVSIRTDPLDEAANVAPVNVSLKPGTRRNYSIGAGFSTDTGPQGRLGYMNRRRNDRGHQVEGRLFVSDTDSEATAYYRWPVRNNPRTDWASIVGGLQHQDTDTSENDTFKLSHLRTRSLSKKWLWTRYVEYSYENFTIADQDDTSELVILGVNFESATGREISRSTHGRRLNMDIRGASDYLGSDTSFLQLRATGKWLWSLSDAYRVMVRGRVGTTIKDKLSELPVSARFFAGGDRSVRGYGFETLGPTDANGIVIGGTHLIEASVEFDRAIAKNWSIAAFADTGSAFNDNRPEFSSGIGLGLRWYSPVGPIRLDFAHPLDDPDRDFRLHVTLGPDL
jgi:translocation and assembly module TamA